MTLDATEELLNAQTKTKTLGSKRMLSLEDKADCGLICCGH